MGKISLTDNDIEYMDQIKSLDDVLAERKRLEEDIITIELRQDYLKKRENDVFTYMFYRWVREGDQWDNWHIKKIGAVFTRFEHNGKTKRLHHQNICRKLYRYSKSFKTKILRSSRIKDILDESANQNIKST